MSLLLTILTTTGILALGFTAGFLVRAFREPAPKTPAIPDPSNVGVREYQRGFEAGHVHGTDAMRAEAERLLAERFPTSTGGRRIVRALGGTVPPMPRVKRAAVGEEFPRPMSSGTVSTVSGVTATNFDGVASTTVSAEALARTPFTLTADSGEGDE